MLQILLVGTILTISTIMIHATGTSVWIGYLIRQKHNFKTRFGNLFRELKVLSFTAGVLLLIHGVEVLMWAGAYLWFVSDEFGSFEEAVYFSTVTFTSLGYGDIVIAGRWRMLSAYQAMTGLLVFGWSTALLFAVVQKVWERKFETGS